MIVKNVVEALKKFGIRAQAYAKPPVAKDVFVLSILPRGSEGTIAIHQGKAVVDVHGSKVERQAVLSVVEKARTITWPVKTVSHQEKKPTVTDAHSVLQSAFPTQMGSETKWTYSNVKIERPNKEECWRITGTVKASVGKKTTNNFLVGVDESHNFVAPLPKKVRSVHEAHMLLKPPGLRAGSVRQGEWFFEPCTKEECAKFNKMVDEKGNTRVRSIVLGRSTHVIKSGMWINHVIYAIGFVTDKHHDHHASLFLPKWHKVVRNKEIPMPRRREPLSRRQSWD